SVSAHRYLLVRLPRPTPTLFPYTTLFRSPRAHRRERGGGPHAPAAHRAVSPALSRDRRRRAPRPGAADCGRSAAGQSRFWRADRSEEHTSELQSRVELVCRLLLEKEKHHE